MIDYQQNPPHVDNKEARRIYLENEISHLKQVAKRVRRDKSKSPKKSFCEDYLMGISFE